MNQGSTWGVVAMASEIGDILAHERRVSQTLSPITFVLLRAASGPRDELQAAASRMAVVRQELFLNVPEIGDIFPHAASRSTVWSQFVDDS